MVMEKGDGNLHRTRQPFAREIEAVGVIRADVNLLRGGGIRTSSRPARG